MIAIDFQGGAHGNFLEFVCNTLAGITVGLPFDASGASHAKQYTTKKIFVADHYSFLPKLIEHKKVVSIHIDHGDLLPLQQISLLRAGNFGYDNDFLEKDTFHKLNNVHYRWMLDKLIDGYFKNQVEQSYNAVKDDSWPIVKTIDDFNQLPDWIKHECRTLHKLELLELNDQTPDCPRSILRSFFQAGFEKPEQNGFIERQNAVRYSDDKDVFVFPFSSFYSTQEFSNQVEKIANWAGFAYNSDIENLHFEFLQRQPYCNSKNKCDILVKKIKSGSHVELPVLSLLEEAYVNVKVGENLYS